MMESFLALSKILNYRRTAASLFISEPSLSAQIHQLEAEYNCELIDRRRRQIKLTPAGKQLAISAERLFDEVQRMNTLMYRFNKTNHLLFKLGASGVHLIFPLAQQLQQSYPNYHFTFTETFNKEMMNAVLQGELTVGFTFLDTVPNTLQTTGIFNDELIAVVNTRDPAFDGISKINALSLVTRPLAVLKNGFYINHSITQYFRYAGIAPSFTYKLESYYACIDQVQTQSCITLVPRSFFESLQTPSLRCIDLIGKQPRLPMGLVYRQEESADPIIHTLKCLARQRYATVKK